MNFYYDNIGKYLKKNGACIFLSTVFFLSFLAGKFATYEQMLLTKPINNFFEEMRRVRIFSGF